MTDDVSDGGTDSWTSGGATALAEHAPEVFAAYGLLTSVRPIGVHDEMLESAAVAAFAEQFGVHADAIDQQVRDRFTRTTGDHAAAVVDMVWISDVSPRIRETLDAVFGPSDVWPGKRRYPVSDTQVAIQGFAQSVALLDRLDADLTDAGQAALALVDAMNRTPSEIPGSTVEAVHELLTPAQAVEVVLDAARSSADRIPAALG
ncbi:hypothetical protein [Nocardioides conyzicola]|uniref:Uncharacterized protein n=1 Tax=Nocardioides conyzicola TaxID=1651781 RepID=A0ABP8XEY4_9ACTN